MSTEEFEVDTELLRCGADLSRSAAESAKRAANVLAQVKLPYGMFGDFDEAHLFGVLLATVRDEQAQQLHADYVALTAIAERASAAAEESTYIDGDEELADRPEPQER